MNQEHTINIPLPSPPRPPRIIPERRKDYFNICVPLYEASIRGDWAAAKLILDRHPKLNLVRYAITEGFETALHVAASAEETKQTVYFVENLVKRMTMEELELQNMSSNTAFCIAAATGNIKTTIIMMDKYPKLLIIPGMLGLMPLYLSASQGRYKTVNYLYDHSWKLTDDSWTNENWGWLLHRCVECDFFDIALKIMKDRPELATKNELLTLLARKPYAFEVEQKLLTRIIISISRIIRMKVGAKSADEKDTDALKLLRVIWRNTIMVMPTKDVYDLLRGPCDSNLKTDGNPQYSSRLLFLATELGNTRFVIELLRAYPDLIWDLNDDNQTIFHIAVMNRHLDIYNLLYEIGLKKDAITRLVDRDGNNMLHLVGKTTVKMRPQTSRASLLMQRELLWYKEIEKKVPAHQREKKNKNGLTPYELFSEENKDLVSHGLKWTKDCMVVSTLIVTVAFGVAFTVPGGYKQEIGIPIFINGGSFLVFVIADAVSLFSSSTSLLVFLSIITSRHGQRDFMHSLPRKLMIGLVTLFISVVAMMVTFSASFFVLYRNELKWIPILISTFATMPVIIYAVLQFPLLVDMFRSMYDSRYLFNPKKLMLYNTTPML